MTQLVEQVGSAIERRTSRRGFLTRVVAAGAVASLGPIKFLVRPDAAQAILPDACPSGSKCRDGWTEFCAAIQDRGSNTCPSDTFVGGYWKCSNYGGNGYCDPQDVRYYVDCNILAKDRVYYGCALKDCSCRVQNYNQFQYGNCNTGKAGYSTSYVKCRQVKCHNPAQDYAGCGTNYVVENATCGHHACCCNAYV
jgi:hypothetical protein